MLTSTGQLQDPVGTTFCAASTNGSAWEVASARPQLMHSSLLTEASSRTDICQVNDEACPGSNLRPSSDPTCMAAGCRHVDHEKLLRHTASMFLCMWQHSVSQSSCISSGIEAATRFLCQTCTSDRGFLKAQKFYSSCTTLGPAAGRGKHSISGVVTTCTKTCMSYMSHT